MSATLLSAARPRSLPIHQEPASPPPFALPGEHFAAAFTWLTLGSVGLVHVAPALAAGNFLEPHVLAVTHMFTLGVITTSIFGALYQLLPVLLGVKARSVPLGHTGFWLLTVGTATLVVGFWWWVPALLLLGWAVLFAAVGCVAANLLPARRQAKYGKLVGWYISAGHSALGLAMALALARIGEAAEWWTVDRLGFIAAHLSLAAIGFASLTAVGVGSRMIPMFLQSHGAPGWPLKAIGPLAAVGLVVQSIGLVWHVPALTASGAVVLLVAAACYLYLAGEYFRHRTVPLDPAIGHIGAALVCLACAAGSGLVLLLRPGALVPRHWVLYGVLMLLGWLVMLIIGVYHRILPFLTWLHLHGPASREQRVASVEALLTPRLAWASLVTLVLGVALLVGGIGFGVGAAAQAGAAVYLGGVVMVVFHHLRVLRA